MLAPQKDTFTVLVVEDDAGIRALYRELLCGHGHAVFEVDRGDEAVERARSCRPDVIVLDLGLPGLGGLGVLEDLKADPELEALPVIVCTARDDTSAVTAALATGAHDYVRKPFQTEEIAARVAAAGRLKAHQDSLLAEASVDQLTRLGNRRALDQALEREHARATRTGQPLSLLVIDLDRFKAVNDELGHQAGDLVLVAVADRLRQRARVTDVVGRWGGEEFVMIAPATTEEGAAALAEAVREAIAATPVQTDGASIPMTTSVGVATWAGETTKHLLARADRALYAAKSQGRDRVVVAPPRLRVA